jgi:hypothetical protein
VVVDHRKTGALAVVQEVWHPSGVRILRPRLPEVCASLRPPATFWEPLRGSNQDANGYHGVLRKTQKKISSTSQAQRYLDGMKTRRYGLPVTALLVNPNRP